MFDRALCGSPGTSGVHTGVAVNTSIQPTETPAASEMNQAAIHLSGDRKG